MDYRPMWRESDLARFMGGLARRQHRLACQGGRWFVFPEDVTRGSVGHGSLTDVFHEWDETT